MQLRVIVLTSDLGLSELVRAQVENLGCACNQAQSFSEASTALDWADAAIIDLAGDGIDALVRLRATNATLKTLAIALDDEQSQMASAAGADHVLVEFFAISELVEVIRAMGRPAEDAVLDLRAPVAPAFVDDEAPWWATR